MAEERPMIVIKTWELQAEFERLSGGDGSIDFSEISRVEEKFGLPMSISTDMKYWKDMKIDYREFVDMLKRNGNIAKDGGNVKLQVRRADVDAAFAEAGGSDGIIDFMDIEKVEKKYGLPMNISGDMKYWKDMKITKDEFIEMLERNGNIAKEGEDTSAAPAAPAEPAAAAPAEAAAPAAGGTSRELPVAEAAASAPAEAAASAPAEAAAEPTAPRDRIKALFRAHTESSDDTLSLATLERVVMELGGAEWPQSRLQPLVETHAKDGRIQIGAFLDWCFS